MTTVVEAEKYVLFLLRELGTANEHHHFEGVCARLARMRVSSNIVLATGPVSAGGDQGRDAESYFTRLPDEMPGAGGFIGMASTEPVVVACTVQQTGLSGKIRSDLDSICSQGEAVGHVAYFTVAAVPAATQHASQEYARTTHHVHLDVFDGPTIAAMLVDPDVIWLAKSLLDLPESLVPERTEEPTIPDWYVSDLAMIRDLTRPLSNAGDVTTVSDGMRYAATHTDLAGDLGDWMRAAERLIGSVGNDGSGRNVAARCRYELIAASVRGVGSFSDRIDQHARELLEAAIHSDDPGLLLDGSTALMFCGGVWARHGTTLAADDLRSYLDRLRERVDSLIGAVDQAVYPLRHARLVATAAYLALHPRWGEIEQPPPGTLPPTFERVEAFEGGMRALAPTDEAPFDVDEAISRLAAFADVASAARGLPIQELSRAFDMLAPLLAAAPRYPQIRDALDAATAELHGDGAAGIRARDRGVALREAGQPLLALRELHEAKIRWFHGDTLRGALLTMVVIANIYRDLGLLHAAKQYALATAAGALGAADPDKVADLVAPAIALGSISSYNAGAWFDALALGHIARMAHGVFAEHAFDYDEHSELHDLDLTEGFVVSAARTYRPALLGTLENILSGYGTWDSTTAMLDATGPPSWTETEFGDMVAEQLLGLPFSDTGPQRHLRFAALGTTWNITCSNDRTTVLAAERLAAATQVLIADLALLDPVFLPSRLDITVSTDTPLDHNPVRFRPANDRIQCQVYLPRYRENEPIDEFQTSLLSVVLTLTGTVSALPQQTFTSKVTACAAAGLFNRIVVGQPYDSVAGMLDEGHYAMLAALPDTRIGNLDSTAAPRQQLEPPTTAGPYYDQAAALERARWRYEHLPQLISESLPRVLNDASIRSSLAQLRADGWLDWQLLLALHNVAANARARNAGLDAQDPAQHAAIRQLFYEPEAETSALLPLSEFTHPEIEFQLGVGLMTELKTLGLESHTQTPDLIAIAHLLRTRYGYGTDDVEHDDLLNIGDDIANQ